MVAEWCNSIEEILKQWAEKSAAYRALHLKSYARWTSVTNAIYIPIIVCSSLSGVLSFGNTGAVNNVVVSYVVGSINVVVGMLTSILKFLRCEEKANAHKLSARGYGSFFRTVIMELSMNREHRSNGDEFCRTCKVEFDRLHDEALPINEYVIEWYKETFTDKLISLPELGIGNVEVKINRDSLVNEFVGCE